MLISRFVMVAYAVLAVFSYREARKLLKNSVDLTVVLDDDKMLFPLVLCFPYAVKIGEEIFTADDEGVQCQALNFLINACAASLIFSVIAAILFVFIDVLARYKKGPFNLSTAAGMGLFLTFILIQTGISTYALVRQVDMWIDYFRNVVETDLQIKSFCDTTLMKVTVAFAFGATILITIDIICDRFFRCNRSERNNSSMQSNNDIHPNSLELAKETELDKKSSRFSLFRSSKKSDKEETDHTPIEVVKETISDPSNPSWSTVL